jgi:hypothetical protein
LHWKGQCDVTQEATLWSFIIQGGFAGLCLVLIVVGVFVARGLFRVLWALNVSVTQNTEVTRTLGDKITQLSETALRRYGPDYAETQKFRPVTSKVGGG